MLAEPRRRKRYNLVPRLRALYDDETRFGTKMLEKMGWKKGQGLGANENGSKDFVKIRYKNDAFGLGFEQRDDQWTQHEQTFNGLLKTLNKEESGGELNVENENKSENDIPLRVGFGFRDRRAEDDIKVKFDKMREKISGISLEERSKKSKARVHYKKFTKGKDIAQYSEKDLANIFGKKALGEQDVDDFFHNVNNTFGRSEKSCKDVQKYPEKGVGIRENNINKSFVSTEIELEENCIKKIGSGKGRDRNTDEGNVNEIKKTEQEHNSQIIYSNLSINDYFKLKMENRKRKSDFNIGNINFSDVQKDDVTKKKKKYANNLENGSVLEAVKKKPRKNAKTDVQQNYKNKGDDIKIEMKEIKSEKNKDKSKFNKNTVSSNENSAAKKIHFDNGLENGSLSGSLIEDSAKMDLTQEPTKLKRVRTNEISEKIEMKDNDKNKNTKDNKRKNKSKISNQSIEISVKVDNLPISKQSKNSLNNHPKDRRKGVSSSAKSVFISEVNFQLLDLELQQKCKAFNIYTISSFCAEKFRNINLNDFEGSVLPQIEGYGLGSDLQLDVQIIKKDEERITNLWKGVLNKYAQLDKPKKTYQHYIQKVINARKTKQKRPKLYVKAWKRKNAFQVI